MESIKKNIIFSVIFTILSRQACAIESAATHNPTWNIYILFASHVGSPRTFKDPALTALEKHNNIYFRNVDILTYDSDTPAKGWARKRLLKSQSMSKTTLQDYLALIR